MDDIQSRRFLNCDGIKTGSIEDFLVGIGLPMYVSRVAELGSAETNLILNKPADLLRLTDEQIIALLGFNPYHVAWLRREAAAIPSVVFTQFVPRRFVNPHARGSRVNSLPRSSKRSQKHDILMISREFAGTNSTEHNKAKQDSIVNAYDKV
ncbi:unnamed protein product [Echinostoma caproni]|uniref:SAM domain-containing protein n=1 Tax=Echinostoma caproni TaxID=27848 RepID=A0A183AA18_9TREM|nr:unnamed protein product [Echinostoma caproni]